MNLSHGGYRPCQRYIGTNFVRRFNSYCLALIISYLDAGNISSFIVILFWLPEHTNYLTFNWLNVTAIFLNVFHQYFLFHFKDLLQTSYSEVDRMMLTDGPLLYPPGQVLYFIKCISLFFFVRKWIAVALFQVHSPINSFTYKFDRHNLILFRKLLTWPD